MFSAHLSFGDIDKHSSMPFPRRREQLEAFWEVCERFRPQQIDAGVPEFRGHIPYPRRTAHSDSSITTGGLNL